MVGMSELYDSLQEIKEDKKINTKIYIIFFIYILTCLFNEKCNEPEKKINFIYVSQFLPDTAGRRLRCIELLHDLLPSSRLH